MRLLDTETFECHSFLGSPPDYAILSHTWGKGEVALADLVSPRVRSLAGWSKIQRACELARSEGWRYIWIDTCCIDKTSSAELSEAINSMYQWYRQAVVCYVFLEDYQHNDLGSDNHEAEIMAFGQCRWFSRGWTLQELLAPAYIQFHNRDWQELGTKSSLEYAIRMATGIKAAHLIDHSEASVATKMSWASKRETTRFEDEAYCLLGLFDVNMPLLYGEGRKAFRRLQAQILAQDHDDSLFAWTPTLAGVTTSGLFAQSPAEFRYGQDITQNLGIESARGRGVNLVGPAWNITRLCLGMDLPNLKKMSKHDRLDISSVAFKVYPRLLCRTDQVHILWLNCNMNGEPFRIVVATSAAGWSYRCHVKPPPWKHEWNDLRSCDVFSFSANQIITLEDTRDPWESRLLRLEVECSPCFLDRFSLTHIQESMVFAAARNYSSLMVHKCDKKTLRNNRLFEHKGRFGMIFIILEHGNKRALELILDNSRAPAFCRLSNHGELASRPSDESAYPNYVQGDRLRIRLYDGSEIRISLRPMILKPEPNLLKTDQPGAFMHLDVLPKTDPPIVASSLANEDMSAMEL